MGGNAKVMLVVFLLLLAAAGGLFLILGGETDPLGGEGLGTDGELGLPAPRVEAEAPKASWQGDDLERSEIEVPSEVDESPQEVLLYVGRVISHRGAPVAKAKVTLSLRQRRRGRGGWLTTKPVATDAGGRFQVKAKASTISMWNALVQHTAYTPLVDGGVTPASEGRVELGDLVIGPGGQVEGVVLSTLGGPVAGARVAFNPGGRAGFMRWGGTNLEVPPVETLTDAQGIFRLPKVPRGEGRLRASHDSFVPGTSALVRMKDEQRIGGVKIKLQPGFNLVGTVADQGGVPVAGARIRMVGGRGQSGRWRRYRTDRKGSFKLPPQPAGELMVVATAAGYQPAMVWLKLENGTPPQPLALTLPAGGVLAGRVVDGRGRPITRYAIRPVAVGLQAGDLAANITLADGGSAKQALDRMNRESRAGRSGRDGRGGRLEDMMRRFGGRDLEQRLRRMPPEIRQRLEQMGVGGGGSGGGLAGAIRSAMFTVAQPWSAEAEHADGTFSLAGLLPCKYRLEIRAPGYQRFASENFDLGASKQLANLKLELKASLDITGKVVVKAGGKPVSGARVFARAVASGDNGSGQDRQRGRRGRDMRRRGGWGSTDKEGQFTLTDLRPGTYKVTAMAEGHGTEESEPVVVGTDSKTPPVVIEMGGAGIIEGRVTGFKPSERAKVIVGVVGAPDPGAEPGRGRRGGPGRGGGRPRMTGVDKEGRFRLTGINPGHYYVRAFAGLSEGGMRSVIMSIFRSGPDGTRPQADTQVQEDKTSTVQVTLTRTPAGTVLGTLTKGGVPAAGYRVFLARKADPDSGDNSGNNNRFGGRGRDFMRRMFGRNSSSEVDVAGGFLFRDVEPGTYNLEAAKNTRGTRVTLGEVQVFDGQESTVSLVWQVGRVEGTLTGSGASMAGYTVRLRKAGGGGGGRAGMFGRTGRIQAKVGDTGRFVFEDLAVATYTVEVYRRERESLPMGRVEVRSGDTSHLDLVWSVATLEATVVDDEGKPVDRALVSVARVEPESGDGGTNRRRRGFRMGRTNNKGVCRIKSLPAGEMSITCRAFGFERTTQPLTLTAGQTGKLTFRLKKSAEGSGRQPGANRGGRGGNRRPGGGRQPGGRGRGGF